jgi:outer membrane protein assembly factor BamA
MFWLMDGALFLDAGNIWAIDQNDGRDGALFRFDSFHKDIALGTGMGFRFDFSFFIFRLDMGLKLRDPSEQDGKRWIHLHRSLNFNNDVAFNIGIGYPF